ncbi:MULTISPECIES: TraR/DksA family transcriptional regulator [unclassified Janthinobacterium]|uniref:TraR/DksA family transcriptional regulator n=1 Tax=unclassified Janthinobacterium TaxID=2610881 RepID=UPI001609776A|nr:MULTISPECIES: TraR/DksA family transcriptional regulator [unclassified Janthinobacterium]MBB5608944.1 DnaK suppressor protein [Janthinobacterium sp. S3T4]MBB5615201.1 DnaK suppressor protein [Janthinobacterium sp. S3M3]
MDALRQELKQGLTQAQCERLRGVLEQRKHALLAQIDNESAEAGERGSLLKEVEASPADNASVRTLNALVSEAAEHHIAQLAIIKHALARFADGSYGLCDNCGEQIGMSRLEARPEARLCIDCQTRLEKARR